MSFVRSVCLFPAHTYRIFQVASLPAASPLVVSPKTANLSFEGVGFEYVLGHPIFKNVCFEIPAGKKLAIVGGKGSGKSTLVRLLYRYERITHFQQMS